MSHYLCLLSIWWLLESGVIQVGLGIPRHVITHLVCLSWMLFDAFYCAGVHFEIVGYATKQKAKNRISEE